MKNACLQSHLILGLNKYLFQMVNCNMHVNERKQVNPMLQMISECNSCDITV